MGPSLWDQAKCPVEAARTGGLGVYEARRREDGRRAGEDSSWREVFLPRYKAGEQETQD